MSLARRHRVRTEARMLGVLFALLGCSPRLVVPVEPRVDVAILPGCPSDPDGTVSECQWRRAAWGAELHARGVAPKLVASGSDVYNGYTEALALRAALVALGVPEADILTESQALHTDENMAYSKAVALPRGYTHFGVASDLPQVRGGCRQLRSYGLPCTPLPIHYPTVMRRLEQGVPRLTTVPTPALQWEPLELREDRLAANQGRARRPPSMALYLQRGLLALVGVTWRPSPPEPDPTVYGGD